MNKQRLVDEFIELVKIDSLSLKEREMADVLKAKLKTMGHDVYEDDTADKIGGNAGNIVCRIKGEKDVPAILLMAHMDTVVPGLSKKPVIDGNVIKTDGTTVLGSDDLAGVEAILETLRVLKEKNIQHGDIEVVFSVAEECGLLGVKNLDFGNLSSKYGFVLDHGGDIGGVAISAPSQNAISIRVEGKAAHAGVEPEKGISAIQIASHAISIMKLGRIDEETTANIGVIEGGKATNIICEEIKITAEARSRNEKKLEKQTQHMKECFEVSSRKFGGKIEFKSNLEYPAFNIDENEEIVNILKNAAQKAGLNLKLSSTGGGSDTNIVNSKGIRAVILGIGMQKVHTVKEQIFIDDMVKMVDFLVFIIKSIK